MILSTSRSEIKNINLIEFERLEDLTFIILQRQIVAMDSALVVLPCIVVFGFSVLQPECQVKAPRTCLNLSFNLYISGIVYLEHGDVVLNGFADA